MSFDRDKVRRQISESAAKGVFIGTSSWKYEGWRGLLYDESRYVYRGKFADARFEKHCLAEYAEVFKTVCLDSAYYKFPDEKSMASMVAQVPGDFQFALKVTGDITIKKFPHHPRHGRRAGQLNEHFLNADLFATAFLKPCEPFRGNVGLLIFEFSRFYKSDYEQGRDFIADLDRFLARLPGGWPYAVELRNEHWLQPDYFNCLTHHGVTHVFNNWAAMPSVGEQLGLAGSHTNPQRIAARFLLKPGREYQEAVETFAPYRQVQEINEEARNAGRKLIARGKAAGAGGKTFIYVNNRLEGNALETIAAMLEHP